jgi:hypothetical protein
MSFIPSINCCGRRETKSVAIFSNPVVNELHEYSQNGHVKQNDDILSKNSKTVPPFHSDGAPFSDIEDDEKFFGIYGKIWTNSRPMYREMRRGLTNCLLKLSHEAIPN